MEPEIAEQSCDAGGVDLTMVRWMLDMTPAERLETLQSFVDAVWRILGDSPSTPT
jgi:hypothetical protein